MIPVRNSDTAKEIMRVLGSQLGSEKQPSSVSENVVCTVEANPRLVRYADIVKNRSGQGAIFTVPAGMFFALCHAELSFCKIVTDTGASSQITIIDQYGSTVPVLEFAGVTLTAERDTVCVSPTRPIKCYPGAISIAGTNISSLRGAISGYLFTLEND